MKKFRSFGGRSYHKKPRIPDGNISSHQLKDIGLTNINGILEKMQEKLKGMEVEGNSGGGVVKVRMNGEYKVLEIDMDPSIMNEEDKEMLLDLLTAAFNDAVDKVNEEKTRLLESFGLGDLGNLDFPIL